MEGGLPMLNCLLQHTLRSLCACSDSSPKWAYAVFWRILPRNYPPPKWDHGGGPLDRAKGNKRNWILVWEDGFCDFGQCERAGNGCGRRRFGADIFFKMTHEVYNFGEGLVGKVASDNSHRWVFRDSPTENDPSFISSWNISIEHQPRAWEAQFNSGIETIALISVREGAIQLGSFDKVVEDLNMVLSIQRKFSYLQSIPGTYAIHRPYNTNHHPQPDYTTTAPRLMQTSGTQNARDDKHQMIGFERQTYEQLDDDKSIYLGYSNSPQNCSVEEALLPLWSIPPLLPSMPSNLGPFFAKSPSTPLPHYAPQGFDHDSILMSLKSDATGGECVAPFDRIEAIDVKVEGGGVQEGGVGAEEESQILRLAGFELHRVAEKCCKS